MSGVSRADKIRIAKAEVQTGPGEKTQHISLQEIEEAKTKGLPKKGQEPTKY